MTLFRCQVIYLAGQSPTNWGHHLYHSKVDGDLSHEREGSRGGEGDRGINCEFS